MINGSKHTVSKLCAWLCVCVCGCVAVCAGDVVVDEGGGVAHGLPRAQDNILPLDASRTLSVAVIGPNARNHATGFGENLYLHGCVAVWLWLWRCVAVAVAVAAPGFSTNARGVCYTQVQRLPAGRREHRGRHQLA